MWPSLKIRSGTQGNGDSNSDEDDASPGSVGKSKRVLANRQSAHRSRLRKLQYIQDLENNVSRLQTEIGQIQPQLGFLREKYTGNYLYANIGREMKTAVKRICPKTQMDQPFNCPGTLVKYEYRV